MSQLEKMARAIRQDALDVENGVVPSVAQCSSFARAALQSLLPPDEGTVEAMVLQVWGHNPEPARRATLARALTAAIQHILKEDA